MSAFNLSALAVRQRAVTLFLILAVTLGGVFAVFKLGREEDPTYAVKVFTVVAAWPGATSQEMQDLVAEPLEKRMQELRWYDRVETFTRPGLALLTVNLKDSTPPSELAEQFYQARKKLGDESHKLPAGAQGPFINDEYSDVIFGVYAVKARGMPLRLLTRQAEELRQRLLHVPGVQKVNIVGEQPERIFVEFSYPRLATLGVAPQDVFDALKRQNTVTAAGSIETKGPNVFVRLDGAYDDLEKIKATPVVAGGRVLALSDVAEVKRGYDDPPTFIVRNDGEPALLLGVVMQDGWNCLTLGKSLDAEQGKIAAELPAGITFSKVSDQAVNIRQAIDEFMVKFVAAVAVVMVVSLLSLGWRVGVVVAAAVPLTLAAVFIIMLVTGRSFDRVTLGALILSLGLLVDDAIIAIEIMVVKMEEGLSRIAAASYAWSHTAAPMLAGTLVTIIGLMPVAFARAGASEYSSNIFWIVGFSLITSWLVAVVFTPYLGVRLLPNIKPVDGGHEAIYSTPRYQRLRRIIGSAVRHKFAVAGAVVGVFLLAAVGMGVVRQQFFPNSDRPELLVEVYAPEGSSIESTSATTAKVEAWLRGQPEAKIVTSYIGQGAPRFVLTYNPELPDPAFAKIVILAPDSKARDALKHRLRERVAAGLAPEARVRVTPLSFGPPTPFPVAFRVVGPDTSKVREIASQVEAAMRSNANMRDVNQDWGQRTVAVHYALDQDRLKLIGLSPADAAQQLQFLLTGVSVTEVREDIRTATIVARSSGPARVSPGKLEDFTLTTPSGKLVPLGQIGHAEVRLEDPILKRRDRVPTITVQGDIDESVQPPQVTNELLPAMHAIAARLPDGYSIQTAGAVEEADRANQALAVVFPIMIILTLITLMFQVRSFSEMIMVFLTAPLGLVGVVPILIIARQPFGFTSIIGLIGLSGILMRNTLILSGQIKSNREAGLAVYDAVVEATVQRARPVLLTALAAILAFIPLTQSVFWGSMAWTLIGGTAAGTALTLLFLPSLYALWFRVRPPGNEDRAPTRAPKTHETTHRVTQPEPAIRAAGHEGHRDFLKTVLPTRLWNALLGMAAGMRSLGSTRGRKTPPGALVLTRGRPTKRSPNANGLEELRFRAFMRKRR